MQVGEVWMGAQMWADDLVVATSHADWETAKGYMKVVMRSTKEWADTHGVRFCDDKSKVLVIGKQFSGACEQTERTGVSKTKWPIGTEERAPSTLVSRSASDWSVWKAHVDDIVSLSKPKHRQVQPLAASPYVDPAVVERAWEQKVPPCLLKGLAGLSMQSAALWRTLDTRHSGGGGRAPDRPLECMLSPAKRRAGWLGDRVQCRPADLEVPSTTMRRARAPRSLGRRKWACMALPLTPEIRGTRPTADC
jgi:hypothetical protein